MKEKIIDMTLNGSGVRDIGRVLHINKNTVVSVLKKNSKNEPLFSFKNNKDCKINWQFSTDDARIKLKRLYPSF